MFKSQQIPLKRSQIISADLSGSGQKVPAGERCFKEFSLPKNVTNYLEKQDLYHRDLKNHIEGEKGKIEKFILDLKNTIVGEIDKKHQELNLVFDEYEKSFDKNSKVNIHLLLTGLIKIFSSRMILLLALRTLRVSLMCIVWGGRLGGC